MLDNVYIDAATTSASSGYVSAANGLGVRCATLPGCTDMGVYHLWVNHHTGNAVNIINGDVNQFYGLHTFTDSTGLSVNINPVNAGDAMSTTLFNPAISTLFIQAQGGGALTNGNVNKVTVYNYTAPSVTFSGAGIPTNLQAWGSNNSYRGTPFAFGGAADAYASGIYPDGSGYKHKRVASCTTAASANATCATTVTWTTAFVDALYTTTVTLDAPSPGGGCYVNNTAGKVGASVAVGIENSPGNSSACSGTIDVIAVHD